MRCHMENSARIRSVGESQTEVEDRLASMHEDFLRSDIPLGVLWVTVDQARGLRRTHGARACEAMLEKVERTLASGLKPAEEIGRWGDDEFLVLSHERSPAMLAAHAQTLAGLARTTDFRWWGDRVSLTVSIGAAQAERGEPLADLLERAQTAMLAERAGRRQSHYGSAGETSMFAIIGIVIGVWRGDWRLPDGEGTHGRAGAAGRVADYCRRRDRNAAGGQSAAHSEGNCRRA